MRKSKILFLGVLFIYLTSSTFIVLVGLNRVEYEIVSKPSHIRDGDTFEISNHPAIRLEDVSCSETYESGGIEATSTLTKLIWGKTVYIDVDDVYRTGPYGRLICLVYVDYNSTHLLNVNKKMVVLGQAMITDYDNQWNPYSWKLYAPKTTNQRLLQLLGYSIVMSLIMVFIVNWIGSKMWRETKSFAKKVNSNIRHYFNVKASKYVCARNHKLPTQRIHKF